MHKNIRVFIICMVLFGGLAHAQECTQKKKRKKEPLRELQHHAVERSKGVILEASDLIEKLGRVTKDVVLVLDEEDGGILGAENRDQLKIYSQNLEELEGAIKKCKSDVESYKVKNSKILK